MPTTTGSADIGLIGLGVMGRNLALNIADHGFQVAAHNRTAAVAAELAAARSDGRIRAHADLGELVAALRPPRPVLLMVQAGAAVDAMIAALTPLLDKGDILIDAGNAHFRDTMRRETQAAADGLRFLGIGVSGGEDGARYGPAIMVGGTAEAYARVRDILTAIAARADDTPCCAHLGSDGAGHFVKMLHNGIEYADMQMIAEVYFLLRHAGGLDPAAMQAVFRQWNEGELGSYLIEITADILGTADPETGQPMLDVILDRAGQKGTGQWASIVALELGVPAPTIAEAVAARALSAGRDARLAAAETYGALAGDAVELDRDTLVATLRDALLAAKVCAYAQGFAVLAAARREFGWRTDLGAVARVWRGGCIIRARFLDRIAEAFARDAVLETLLHDPYFADVLRRCHRRLRAAVSMAAVQGLPAPALASALAYFDSSRSGRLWADMLQAQRDYFGAHTFERVDRPGRFHFPWTGRKAGAA